MLYYTDQQRKEPLYFVADYFEFKSTKDLSLGVVVSQLNRDGNTAKDRPDLLAKDVGTFMCQWCIFERPYINGFSGTDTIKWIIEEPIL